MRPGTPSKAITATRAVVKPAPAKTLPENKMAQPIHDLPLAYLAPSGFYVSADGLERMLGGATSKAARAFFSKLTIVTKNRVGPPTTKTECFSSHTIDFGLGLTRWYKIPRGKARLLATRFKIVSLYGPANRIEIGLVADLFDNQKLVVAYIVESIRRQVDITTPVSPASHPCLTSQLLGTAELNMGAGFGKTIVAAGIIAEFSLPTLYVVPTSYLADQTYSDLKYALTCPVAVWRGSAASAKHRLAQAAASAGGVLVAVINSVVKFTNEFMHGFGLMILDEVHTLCAPGRRKIFSMMPRICVGMSATTEERRDELDEIARGELAADTGPATITAAESRSGAGIVFATRVPGWRHDDVKFTGRVTKVEYRGPPELTRTLYHESNPNNMFTPLMHKQAFSDGFRNELVLSWILAMHLGYESPAEMIPGDDGKFARGPGRPRNIFVFAEECDFVDSLMDWLKERGAANVEDESRALMGGVSRDEIEEAKRASIIFTTYGYSSTGISIAKMDTIVFFTPRRSGMKQTVPRIMRRNGDQAIERRVIDFVDVGTPMKSQWYSRKVAYDFYGFSIEVVKVASPGL